MEFIAFTLFLKKSKTGKKFEVSIEFDVDGEADEKDPNEIKNKGAKTKTETITVKDFEGVNHDKSIVAWDNIDITEKSYKQFFQTLSRDRTKPTA